MIPIVKAIKTRWTNKSLATTITGGIHHSTTRAREGMPYCIFQEIGTPITGHDRSKTCGIFKVQFEVFTNDGNPETSGDAALSVLQAMEYSDKAGTNPLSVGENVSIKTVQADTEVRTVEAGEDIYRSFFTMSFYWTKARTLAPA